MKNKELADAVVEGDELEGGAAEGDERAAEPLSIDIATSAGGGLSQQLTALPPHLVAKGPSGMAHEPEAQLGKEQAKRDEEQRRIEGEEAEEAAAIVNIVKKNGTTGDPGGLPAG